MLVDRPLASQTARAHLSVPLLSPFNSVPTGPSLQVPGLEESVCLILLGSLGSQCNTERISHKILGMANFMDRLGLSHSVQTFGPALS